jgi:hypothetical protein
MMPLPLLGRRAPSGGIAHRCSDLKRPRGAFIPGAERNATASEIAAMTKP